MIIDRCNATVDQRSVWINLAARCRLPLSRIAVVYLQTTIDECKRRVMSRRGHATLPAKQSSMRVVDSFAHDLEPPTRAEGFLPANMVALDGTGSVIAAVGMEMTMGRMGMGSAQAQQPEQPEQQQQQAGKAVVVEVQKEEHEPQLKEGRNTSSTTSGAAAVTVEEAVGATRVDVD